ncbi:PREDICTED: uncharacterized protein LOC108376783 [Rhagoletis zephyria]|uniref:uncharacterized protein LOC108376783 n=1 Tax=Rhagoletis zephyria TaxID=28612 RepID=UPI00081133A8|nr:PREDICTED: uncharacterized protein LOC108376783 [Rhagoletis zephyria]
MSDNDKCVTCKSLIRGGSGLRCEGVCGKLFHSATKCSGLDGYKATIIGTHPMVKFICPECIIYIQNVDLLLRDITENVKKNNMYLKEYKDEFEEALKVNRKEVKQLIRSMDEKFSEKLANIKLHQELFVRKSEVLTTTIAKVRVLAEDLTKQTENFRSVNEKLCSEIKSLAKDKNKYAAGFSSHNTAGNQSPNAGECENTTNIVILSSDADCDAGDVAAGAVATNAKGHKTKVGLIPARSEVKKPDKLPIAGNVHSPRSTPAAAAGDVAGGADARTYPAIVGTSGGAHSCGSGAVTPAAASGDVAGGADARTYATMAGTSGGAHSPGINLPDNSATALAALPRPLICGRLALMFARSVFSPRRAVRNTVSTTTPQANSDMLKNCNNLRIYFQNISGLRTKSDLVMSFSSQQDFDIFFIVETWLTSDFFDAEFFDPMLFVVFRKDRDAAKTGRSRGGGVLIAVNRKFRASLINLNNTDSLLDQLFVRVDGSSTYGSLLYLSFL